MSALRGNRVVIVALSAAIFFAGGALAQTGAKDGAWHAYGGDLGMTRYSPLDQITAENVNDLELAWRWDSVDKDVDLGKTRARIGYSKNTPLMVDGRLYVSTQLNQVAAIDAGTGETIWVYNPKSYERGRRGSGQHRGVAYWTDGTDERIVIATGGRQLIALNAKTGETYPDFGNGGWTDLGEGFDRPINPLQLGFSAPPMILGDTIVLGCLLPDEASNPDIPPGYVRGFDVRSGKQRWIFHTIPHPGEYGDQTWEEGSWETAGAANVWSMMSADPELGYVYFPTGTPSNDFYGGHRPGANLFAESIVCVNAATGERVWHFQGVHHGLWDYDFPAAPILIDITVAGKRIKAVAQVSKQGFTYVFDRVTGEPVWPIEERAVPQTDVPGEITSPTQPFPTKPPPFAQQGITEDDLIDFTPALREEAIEYVRNYRIGPVFTPPAVINEDGTGGTLQRPSAAGGANWGSAGVDAENGILFVQSANLASVAGLIQPDPARSKFRYIRGGPWAMEPRASGLPLFKPPYGQITAIDLNKGEILWQVAHGEGPRNHPLLKDLNLPPLGAPSNSFLSGGGVVVTKTMVIYSHAEVDPNGQYSRTEWWLRAYDKKNGDVLWRKKLPLPPYGVPMTYMHEGKQYIAVSAGGAGDPAALLAYALP